MKKDLYDTLGVARDAKPEAVKAAYRRKAKKAHPDAGGTPEEFRRVELAHRILSDPARRAKYDEDGRAEDRPPLETRAFRRAAEILAAAVDGMADPDGGDPLGVASESVGRSIAAMKAGIKERRRKAALFRGASERLEARAGANRLSEILANHAAKVEDAIAMIEAELEEAAAVMALLAGYRYVTRKPKPAAVAKSGFAFASLFVNQEPPWE